MDIFQAPSSSPVSEILSKMENTVFTPPYIDGKLIDFQNELRSMLLATIDKYSDVTEEGNDSEKLDAMLKEIEFLLEKSLTMCEKIRSEALESTSKLNNYKDTSMISSLPFVLLEDALDCVQLSHKRTLLQSFLSTNKKRLTSKHLFNAVAKLILIRICNKCLSINFDAEFSGYILTMLSNILLIDERSATNPSGRLNTENITTFDSKEDFKCDPFLGGSIQDQSQAGEKKALADYPFYEKLWGLQSYFSNYNRVLSKNPNDQYNFSNFISSVNTVLFSFEGNLKQDVLKNLDRSTLKFESIKYLTSSHLLQLQIHDPEFQMKILTQLLVVLHHLLYKPITDTKLTQDDRKTLEQLQVRVGEILEKILHPYGRQYYDLITWFLSRREVLWKKWKENKCQKLQKPPSISKNPPPTQYPPSLPKLDISKHDFKFSPNIFSLTQEEREKNVLTEFLDFYVESMDEEAGIEFQYMPQNNPLYCFRAMRFMRNKYAGECFPLVRKSGELYKSVRSIWKLEKNEDLPPCKEEDDLDRAEEAMEMDKELTSDKNNSDEVMDDIEQSEDAKKDSDVQMTETSLETISKTAKADESGSTSQDTQHNLDLHQKDNHAQPPSGPANQVEEGEEGEEEEEGIIQNDERKSNKNASANGTDSSTKVSEEQKSTENQSNSASSLASTKEKESDDNEKTGKEDAEKGKGQEGNNSKDDSYSSNVKSDKQEVASAQGDKDESKSMDLNTNTVMNEKEQRIGDDTKDENENQEINEEERFHVKDQKLNEKQGNKDISVEKERPDNNIKLEPAKNEEKESKIKMRHNNFLEKINTNNNPSVTPFTDTNVIEEAPSATNFNSSQNITVDDKNPHVFVSNPNNPQNKKKDYAWASSTPNSKLSFSDMNKGNNKNEPKSSWINSRTSSGNQSTWNIKENDANRPDDDTQKENSKAISRGKPEHDRNEQHNNNWNTNKRRNERDIRDDNRRGNDQNMRGRGRGREDKNWVRDDRSNHNRGRDEGNNRNRDEHITRNREDNVNRNRDENSNRNRDEINNRTNNRNGDDSFSRNRDDNNKRTRDEANSRDRRNNNFRRKVPHHEDNKRRKPNTRGGGGHR